MLPDRIWSTEEIIVFISEGEHLAGVSLQMGFSKHAHFFWLKILSGISIHVHGYRWDQINDI